MKHIIHIISDDPTQVTKFRKSHPKVIHLKVDGPEPVHDNIAEYYMIAPYLQTTEDGMLDVLKRRWSYIITIQDKGNARIEKT